ncbi:putative copper homeostasis protein [Lindgomyces ingoldianus]|uniref:Copper homeostasis protein n=1 Tax=Lindgomyces ingoldianus TaxID=673940 RepID=A0ACB6RFA7_9PLEO|nr:putative copper homeostasis protein [Lindgomyces ingoldianus]KAF2477973.1 putative copper homeostasis protein [Lindgomyces ingoldianus]
MLEIACFNASSAVAAAKAGADRIELCVDYTAGGTTPTQDSLRETRVKINIPVNVMIRPRSGNFIYSEEEFKQMSLEIQMLKPAASGFVFGILDDQNHVDLERNRALVGLAAPLPCTFHRAFDLVPDFHEATENIITCGFKSILTSGGMADAVSGAGVVGELWKNFGDRIDFILGGGVRSTNVESLRQTKINWYHSAAITKPGEEVDEEEVVQLQTALKRK